MMFSFLYFAVCPTIDLYYDVLSENNAKMKWKKKNPAWIAIYAIYLLLYVQQFGQMSAKMKFNR